jgi:hydroxymethylglutaryl-CoA reductase (NADPH)
MKRRAVPRSNGRGRDLVQKRGSVRLTCDFEGARHVVDVLRLSHQGLTVAQTKELAGASAGSKWTQCTVETEDRRQDVPLLVVVSVDEARGRVRLVPGDDPGRVGLWRLMYLGGTSSASVPGSQDLNTGVDSIPARGQQSEAARLERLEFVRAETGAALESLQEMSLVARRLSGNIENLVGSVAIPVGLAGPLFFRGSAVEGVAYAPMATTEGTLVASATRGARALTRSGGVVTRVLAQRMLRAPLFVVSTLEGALLFSQWLRDHRDELSRVIGEVSRHARLIDVNPLVLGRHVHTQFLYETGDAAGQNMTTTCTWHACQWILAQMAHLEEVHFENFVVEANLSSDKKVTYQSFVSGRGTRVVAEAFLSRQVLEQVLKVSPEQLLRTSQACMAGSIQAGMVGFNINVSNVIAAVFTATGQDIGCVHESSLGQFYLEAEGDGVMASLLLPGLIIGTVGGGTQLPQQRDYLELMGCAGSGKMTRLAEIIAGFCLALDLSTLSAVASGQFAQAHERLGRNRPVEWLKREDLSPEFFQEHLRQRLGEPELQVTGVEHRSDADLGSSIITELTAQKVRKLVGHFPMALHVRRPEGESVIEVIAKVKPLDEEILLMLNSMASMCGPALAASFSKHKGRLEVTGSDRREVSIYELDEPRLRDHMPVVYGTVSDPEREAYVVILERLHSVELKDSADEVCDWTEEHVLAAIEGIAAVHSIWYGREDDLGARPWIEPVQSAESMVEMMPLWRALIDHGRGEFPRWISERDRRLVHRAIEAIPQWWQEYQEMPRTLVHNDFNPRNLCFRRGEDGLRLCLYDWELATMAPPQRDLAELLCFVLPDDASDEVVTRYVEAHRLALERATGHGIDPTRWRRGYELGLRDFVVNRLGLYLMAHTFRHYGFMERVVDTVKRLTEIELTR